MARTDRSAVDVVAAHAPVAHDHLATAFRFHTGEVVDALRLRYTTFGNPDGDAVLVLHGTGGSGRSLLSAEFGGRLFGRGQPFDADRHLIVLPDALGHGGSAKPSDGRRSAFPAYDYDDMVEAQYRVVSEALGLRHLRAIVGVSMGGMHAWLWGTRHPRFMDALIPLSSLPAPMSGRNWLMRRLLVDAIRDDPRYDGGRYVEQPPAARAAFEFFSVATNGGTLALQAAAPTRAAADRWLETRRALPFTADANDLVYQWNASRDYDPSSSLHRIRASVLAILSDDDERNPLETGIAQRAIESLPDARLLIVPGSASTRGHGTVGMAALWADACGAFLANVPSKAAAGAA